MKRSSPPIRSRRCFKPSPEAKPATRWYQPPGSDSSAPGSPQQFSPDVLNALLSLQGQQANPAEAAAQSLVGKFDANGDGQISQSEFETAIGGDQSKADQIFQKLDANGDGSVTQDELKSALRKNPPAAIIITTLKVRSPPAVSRATIQFQALLSGVSTDGATSQSATNADGSSTTTITYSDGTKVELTTPATSSDQASASPSPPNFAGTC